MIPRIARALAGACVCFVAGNLFAGGSGLNVLVVVNQSSTNSVQLGNYYCEQRHVPPQNVLRINWTGGNVEWAYTNYQQTLLDPLVAMLAARELTNQIDFIVLSMDIPYRISSDGTGWNSTTSALFYGFKPDSRNILTCPLAGGSANVYAGSELPFRDAPPNGAASNAWLTLMLTSSNLAQARAIVDRGLASDGSFPTQTVYLGKSTDPFRNVRYYTFDDAVFNVRLRGDSIQRINQDGQITQTNMLGYENGLYQFTIKSNAFAPGAIADSLTSFGGKIYEVNDHTILLVFLNAGATGSYGTIVEPCNYLEKFPSPQDYFYQARGFSLAESYYLSVTNPYEGLMVGEPLAAPFERKATGAWLNLSSNAVLAGTTNLAAGFTAADGEHPVRQVDWFLDGKFLAIATNITPALGNVLYVTLPGETNLSYTVPADATLQSIATGLAAVLNSFATSNTTKVSAFAHGDRIELQFGSASIPGSPVPVSVSNSIGSGASLTTYVQAATNQFLDSVAFGTLGCDIGGFVIPGDILQLNVTTTNGTQIFVGVTNTATGVTLLQFVQQFVNAINATVSLQGSDGLVVEDVFQPQNDVTFNLRARSAGLSAAQIQVTLFGTFDITPIGPQTLTDNLAALAPRNHLYVTAGTGALAVNSPLDTTALADGFHELTAVAYEGSSVRTESRIDQTVQIRNGTLSAVFTTLVGGVTAAREARLQFSVMANTNDISRIELFSTGGSVGFVDGQSNAVFSVPATNLDVGLHPFYAVVNEYGGVQYRTETKWIRIVGAEAPFPVTILSPPPTLFWPATAGRSYDVLSVTDLTLPFQLFDTVVPSNSAGQWTDTNAPARQRFYQIRVSP